MTIYNLGSIILYSSHGPVAQLGAHYIRIVGVGSSNLLGSTKNTGSPFGGPVFFIGRGDSNRTMQQSGGLLPAAGWTAAAPKCTESPRVHQKHRHPTGEMLPPDKNGGGKICFTGCLLL